MNRISDWIAGIGMLIALFLVLSRSRETVSIINSFASNATAGIKVLQGR